MNPIHIKHIRINALIVINMKIIVTFLFISLCQLCISQYYDCVLQDECFDIDSKLKAYSCNRSSPDFTTYEDFYNTDLSMWIPIENDNIKIISVNFVIAQYASNDPRNFSVNGVHPSGMTDIEFLEILIETVNELYANLPDPSDIGGQTICGTCNDVKDTKIQFSLEDIHFIVDPTIWHTTSTAYRVNQNSEINIIAHDANLNYSWAVLPSYDLSFDQYMVFNRLYTDYLNDPTLINTINNRSRGIAHELGHILGLCHTNLGGGCPFSCSSIKSSGYYFDDHFGTYPGSCPDIYTFWNDNPWIYNNDQITNNLLGPYVCYRGYLSSKQIGAIHRNLALKSCRKFLANGVYNTSFPIVITENEVWDFNFRLDRDITITNGGSLTLQCELFMPEDGTIEVESGGELIIDGVIITNADVIVKNTGTLSIINNGKLLLNSNDEIIINTGAICNFNYGDIELIE